MRSIQGVIGFTHKTLVLLLGLMVLTAIAAGFNLAVGEHARTSHLGLWLAGIALGLVGWWAIGQWRPRIRSMGPSSLRAHVIWRATFMALTVACILNALAPLLVRAMSPKEAVGASSSVATSAAQASAATAKAVTANSSAGQSVVPHAQERSEQRPEIRLNVGRATQRGVQLPVEAQKAIEGAAQAASQALQAAKDAEDRAKEIKTSQSDWGTLFAWLLAVVAVVISFVTSWVLLLSREVKTQADEVYAALDVESRYRELILRMDLEHALRSLRTLHDGLDPNSGYSTRCAANAVAAALSHVPRLFDPLEDAADVEADLFKALAALKANATRNGVTPDLGRLINSKALPSLEAHHAAARDLPQAQREPGITALDRLAEFIRTCRSL